MSEALSSPGVLRSTPLVVRLVLLAAVLCVAACAKGEPVSVGPDAQVGPPAADAAPPPDADTCAGDPCALVEQCGCGGAQVCDLDDEALDTGGTLCRDVTIPGNATSNCADETECGAGFSCFGGGGFGQCRQYCDPAAPDCGAGGFCIIQVVSGADPVPGAVLCTKTCDPVASSNNGCPSSPQLGCRIFFDDPDGAADSGDEYFLTDCSRAASAGLHDADCTASGDSQCAAGHACFTITGGANPGDRCRQYCELTPGPGVCAGGRTCVAVTGDQPTIDGKVYGVCQ